MFHTTYCSRNLSSTISGTKKHIRQEICHTSILEQSTSTPHHRNNYSYLKHTTPFIHLTPKEYASLRSTLAPSHTSDSFHGIPASSMPSVGTSAASSGKSTNAPRWTAGTPLPAACPDGATVHPKARWYKRKGGYT